MSTDQQDRAPSGAGRVYLLIEDFGAYTDATTTVFGVFSTAEKAMAARPELSWAADMTAESHFAKHDSTGWGGSQCCSRWSVEEWTIDLPIDNTQS